MQEAVDVVLIVTGIVWSIVFLIVLAVVVVVFWLFNRYLNVAHIFLRERVSPILADAGSRAAMISAQSSHLPGQTPVEIPQALRQPHRFDVRQLGFRRRRPWWQRLLGR